uniref:Uncharacterized protein n=1 Tax=Toxoplasma gondii COUG TaxID=1074873 RepID=A0A2G8Y520_TOXGO|nr:hypothetical protein TGCOUG_205630 [Toxoplasma gondii COUG]
MREGRHVRELRSEVNEHYRKRKKSGDHGLPKGTTAKLSLRKSGDHGLPKGITAKLSLRKSGDHGLPKGTTAKLSLRKSGDPLRSPKKETPQERIAVLRARGPPIECCIFPVVFNRKALQLKCIESHTSSFPAPQILDGTSRFPHRIQPVKTMFVSTLENVSESKGTCFSTVP